MKRNKLSLKNLKDSQLVYIEFDFNDITQCGTDEEYDEMIEEVSAEYEDGIFKVDLANQCFIRLNSKDDGVYFYHNLIGDVYEI